MGEPEQLIAEPDEIEEEDVEGLHPPTLQQQNPRFLTYVITSATSFLAANGWHAVGIFLLGCIAWIQFGPKVQSWLRKREEEKEAAENHREPDAFLAKQRAIDEARRRMQEQYNIAAAISLEKKKEMMEKKKEEKIKEWESKQPSGGRTLRSPDSSAASASVSSAKGKSAPKARLRPEYNPMTGATGASSSCRWRPTAQRPSGGG